MISAYSDLILAALGTALALAGLLLLIATVRAGERLRRLDQVTLQMGERLGQLELRGEGRPYDEAIALVRRGGDAERLISSYGLRRGGADLVALVHRRKLAV